LKEFKPDKTTSRYCSKGCANIGRKGIKYTKNQKQNSSRRRLDLLEKQFDFQDCMIKGCNYNRTYNVHRLLPGKEGGKYAIGNMFAICPNHHAEVHANLITLEKINDYTLMEHEKE